MKKWITVCAVIAGLILIVAGVYTFMNGFHNTDLAFNSRTLEKMFNRTLIDNAGSPFFTAETKSISIDALYSQGISGLFQGMVAVFFGSLMFGYSIRELQGGPKER